MSAGAPALRNAPLGAAYAPPSAYERFRSTKYYASVDGLRGLSILAVIWHHIAGIPSPSGYVPVSLFFGISGFLITTLLLREKTATGDIGLRRFYARRILRTWPLYYLVLAIYVLLVALTERHSAAGHEFFVNLPYFLTYTANWFVDTHAGTRTIFYFAWSLATQEQFYLLWPAVVRFSRSWKTPVLFAIAALALNQVVASALLHGALLPRALSGVALATVSVPICLGALAACLMQQPAGFRVLDALIGWRAAPLALIGAGLAAHFAGASTGAALFTAQAIIVLLVIACCIRPDHYLAPLLTSRAARYLGTISYGIYLTHMLAVNVARHLLRNAPRHPALVFLVAAPLSTALATLSFRTYEAWFAKLKRRYVPSASSTMPARVASSSSDAAAPAGLRVECLTTMAQLDALATEWRALFDRVGDALPFSTYEWAAAWWTHMRRVSGPLRDSLQLFVVRDGAGSVIAIAPMMHTTVRVGGLPVVRVLQPIGTDPNLTEVRGMLVSADREGDALEALSRYVSDRDQESWVQWCGIRRDTGSVEQLGGVRAFRVNDGRTAFVLQLPAAWDEFKKSFPRNLRESLRKCYNSLARDSHEWTLRVVEHPDDIPAAVERLIELHGARAARTDTIVHRDCFDAPEARRFLHQVAATLGARGMVRVFQLVIEGQVVATRIGFVFGDRMFLYYSGYDPAWGRYSVMTTVVAEALQWAIRQGLTSVNLSTGADESKLRWRPTPVEYVDACAVSPSAYARMMHRALDPRTRAKLKRLARRG